MKKLVLLVSAFTAGLLSMGCSDDPENDPALLPELKIDGETTIVVPYVGGSYTIHYTLSAPKQQVEGRQNPSLTAECGQKQNPAFRVQPPEGREHTG